MSMLWGNRSHPIRRKKKGTLLPPYFHQELKYMLLHTNGKIVYKTIEGNLGEVVSANYIKRHVKSLDGSRLRKI